MPDPETRLRADRIEEDGPEPEDYIDFLHHFDARNPDAFADMWANWLEHLRNTGEEE